VRGPVRYRPGVIVCFLIGLAAASPQAAPVEGPVLPPLHRPAAARLSMPPGCRGSGPAWGGEARPPDNRGSAPRRHPLRGEGGRTHSPGAVAPPVVWLLTSVDKWGLMPCNAETASMRSGINRLDKYLGVLSLTKRQLSAVSEDFHRGSMRIAERSGGREPCTHRSRPGRLPRCKRRVPPPGCARRASGHRRCRGPEWRAATR